MSCYLEPFAVYRTFNALKLHFTSTKYDYVKHHGAINATYNSFSKRKDVTTFTTIAHTIPDDTIVPFFISQFVGRNFLTSVTDIVKNPAQTQKIWYEWVDRVSDIRALYTKDLITLAQKSDGSWKSLFFSKYGDYPLLFKLLCSSEISPETYSCLYDVFSQGVRESTCLVDDTMFMSLNLKYTKYRCFINISKKELIEMTPETLADVL